MAIVVAGAVLAWPHVVPSSWPGAAAPGHCGMAPKPTSTAIIQLHLTVPTAATTGSKITTTLTAQASRDVTATGKDIQIVITRGGSIVGRAPVYTGNNTLNQPLEGLQAGRATPLDFNAAQRFGRYDVLLRGCPSTRSSTDPDNIDSINNARRPLAAGTYQLQAIAQLGTFTADSQAGTSQPVQPAQPTTLVSAPSTIHIDH